VKIEQAWIGEGSLTLPVCEGEEISDLAPIRCGKAYGLPGIRRG
jgi:acetoacetate decarboxylase